MSENLYPVILSTELQFLSNHVELLASQGKATLKYVKGAISS